MQQTATLLPLGTIEVYLILSYTFYMKVHAEVQSVKVENRLKTIYIFQNINVSPFILSVHLMIVFSVIFELVSHFHVLMKMSGIIISEFHDS